MEVFGEDIEAEDEIENGSVVSPAEDKVLSLDFTIANPSSESKSLTLMIFSYSGEKGPSATFSLNRYIPSYFLQ